MGLTKNLENGAKIVLLYTKGFKWKNDRDKHLLGNEPIPGRVYRALLDHVTKAYYVSIEAGLKFGAHGIRISALTYNNAEFECDMEVITDDNIIDFEITPEDYKLINTWMEEDHLSFIKKLEGGNGMDVIVAESDHPEQDPRLRESEEEEEQEKIEELGKKVMDALKASTDALETKSGKALTRIGQRDPWMLDAITNLLTYIGKIIEKEDTGPTVPLAKELAIHEDFGMGANIYTAIAGIENYIHYSDSIGGNKNSLNKAMYHLLLELTRLKMEDSHDDKQ